MMALGTSRTAATGSALKTNVLFLISVAGLALLGTLVGDNYVLHIMILICIWAMVASSWDLILGYAGIFNYAQLVFFAVGAYASAMISIYLGVPAFWSILVSAGLGAVFGLLISIPCLRLKGEYIALFTFAVHLAMPPLIQQGRSIGMGGNTGLLGIPQIEILGVRLGPLDKLEWFYFALAASALVIYLIYFVILRSKLGRALIAIRDAPEFAESLGVNIARFKVLVFAIAAAFAGFAGAIYAHYTGVVTPKILGTEFFLMAMIMLAVGGMGRFPGPILGCVLVVAGNELLRSFDEYRLVLLGLGVVLTVLLLPGGMVSITDRLRAGKGT